MKPLKFEDEDYEIFVQKHVFIKDKKSGEYYKNRLDSLTEKQLTRLKTYKEKVPTKLFYAFLCVIAILFVFNYTHLMKLQHELSPLIYGWKMWIVIGGYFIVNIFFHELGHILSLKFFGKKFDKFGFKLNFYVFPAFYVQMNETYMLSRNEKIIVHASGLFINYLFVNIVETVNQLTFSFEPLTKAYMFFSSTLLWNLVPVLNSDGYKIVLAFLDLDEYNSIKKNHWLVLTIQIIGVCIAANTIVHWILYFAN
ncbi:MULTISPECIES: hypothetical protein [Bacillaceae]|jgi:putative peptide zinc metalloprotease protein|uniref:Putative peptide zinc metalloprotease protein n=2 Tax=Heyndrickxia coagulans TaxID=1398 RepID=A0A8B4BUH5_HEYCO|nr:MULTISPECIES: hypothetical protein [Heyndrickxia]AJH78996.1 peptidase M50 family protein [Heyndrickxia coagulans DSM 1 = ATCC 7050]KGT37352.1 peptidase [Heyndrickxia coagulans P38]KYC84274.1 hypothetical protein B4096_1655 [Heyndrickxia coagulans]MCR2846800.1 peptidase [Heyndrickxia coagulans]MDR4224923.1 peptidase [Heyndrickxia coagulans DSM 1 = ATCC 7050]